MSFLMRMAIVSTECAPWKGWGAGTYAATAARAFAGAGHTVHLVTNAHVEHSGVQDVHDPIWKGVQFHSIPQPSDLPMHGWDCDHSRAAYQVMLTLRSLHERTPLDFIEFPDVGAEGYWALKARAAEGAFGGAIMAIRLHLCDHLIRQLNQWPWENRWFATLRHMERECFALADLLLAPSQHVADLVGRTYPACKHKIHVIRNPFDPALLEGSTHSIALRDSPVTPVSGVTRPQVVCVGRLEHRKGVEVLVRAALKVLEQTAQESAQPDFRFIGADTFTGPSGVWMKAHLERLIPSQHRSRFEFCTTKLSPSQVAERVKKATVVCAPALWDNFPYAVLESMWLGTPVITTDACGVAEILEGDSAQLVVRAGDVSQLAECISRVLSDSSLRGAAANRARLSLSHATDPHKIVVEYDGLLRSIVQPSETVHAAECDDSVTVVVPVYNMHEFLGQTIESIRRQSRAATEILIVDDGSTCALTLEAIARHEANGCRVVRQSNGGLSSARNLGIHSARGRWVLPLDADDLLEPTFIEACLASKARNPHVTMVTTLMRCFQNHDPSDQVVYIPLGFDRTLLPVWNCAGPCIALIDRATLISIGGYDRSLAAFEDWDLWCRMARAGCVSLVVPEFLILNRIRGNSMLRSLSRRKAEMLRSILIAKNEGLSQEPDLTLRMLLGEVLRDEDLDGRPDPRDQARSIIEENLRYRLADRAREAVNTLGIHLPLKRWLRSLGD